jgi:protein TonB
MAEYAIDDHLTLKLTAHNQMRMIRICWVRIPDSMRSTHQTSSGRRTVAVAATVIALHGLALWMLQSGLLHRATDLVVPVQVLSEVIEPPRPVPPPPPPAPRPPVPQRVTSMTPVMPAPTPAAQLAVPVNPNPAPTAPTAIAAPAVPLPPMQAPVAQQVPAVVAAPAPAPAPTPAPAPQPKPAPPSIELPSSDADYLQNPRPVYPPMSKRLNEQGTVLVRVLIGVDGIAQQAEIQQSSSFDRLDKAAMATVLQWRYVPGKRAGKPEAMWFTVPIVWVLK